MLNVKFYSEGENLHTYKKRQKRRGRFPKSLRGEENDTGKDSKFDHDTEKNNRFPL